MVAGIPLSVESRHGSLENAPGGALPSLGAAHNHDRVARRLCLIQLDHLGDDVVVQLIATLLQLCVDCIFQLKTERA